MSSRTTAAANSLKVNDPITIENKPSSTSPASPTSSSSSSLQGIVAFLGPVSFADGDDWVGVRLTGDSIGKGKNDGTVKGTRYFERCGPNGGMFVRKATVKVRTLTRLEELRLKRELKGSGSGSVGSPPKKSGGGTTTKADGSSSSSRGNPPRAGISPRKASGSNNRHNNTSSLESLNEDEASVQSMSSMSQSSNRSRLDEIRMRRLALTGKKKSSSPTNSSSAGASSRSATRPSTSPTGSSSGTVKSSIPPRHTTSTSSSTTKTTNHKDGGATTSSSDNTTAMKQLERTNEKMQEKMELLTHQIRSKEEENVTLQRSLQSAEQLAHDANCAKEDAQSALTTLTNSIPSPTPPSPIQQQQHHLSPPTSPTTNTTTLALETELTNTKAELTKLTTHLTDLSTKNTHLTTTLTTLTDEMEKSQTELDIERATSQKAILSLERQLNSSTATLAHRDESHAAHYKESARFQGEIGALGRRVTELVSEKEVLEVSLEELSLDKEGVEEKLEGLEEKLEEVEVDRESAEIEVDELRLELEDMKERAEIAEAKAEVEGAGDGGATSTTTSGVTADREDVAQALSIQNSRLREAILRLREQSTQEKIELTRQLRTLEKSSTLADGVRSDLDTIRASESKLRVEVRELNEMLDQSKAFEGMVEDLSDSVMELEDGNVALQVLVRELEEGSELNGEMEEAQDGEIRALMEEVQNRETIILNLEEAIKMQRRRELDFHNTIKNYKTSNERLTSEKSALLTLQTSTSTTTTSLASTTQKALSHAAQMVNAAAYARKKEAEASFHYVDAQYFSYLSERLESLLPQSGSGEEGISSGGGLGVARMEVMGVKGELTLGKVAVKASLGLRGVGDLFGEVMNKAKALLSITTITTNPTITSMQSIPISETLSQNILTLTHQTNFAQLAIRLSSECVRRIALGQWPDIMTPDASLDFGSSAVHSVGALDIAISELLFTLKEEGSLSPHRSNLGILDQALVSSKLALSSTSDGDDDANFGGKKAAEWSPPGLALFEKISSAKFYCLGAGSLLSSIVADNDSDNDDTNTTTTKNEESKSTSSLSIVQAIRADVTLSTALNKINQMITDISNTNGSILLAGLDVMDVKIMEDVEDVVTEWKDLTEGLFHSVEEFCSSSRSDGSGDGGGSILEVGEKMTECVSTVDITARSLGKLMSILRGSSKTSKNEDEYAITTNNTNDNVDDHHPLSPETHDPWGSITKLVSKIRATTTTTTIAIDDNNELENINYLVRARNVECQLRAAVVNDAKLSIAETRIVSLEKTVSTRSREIGMQNSRLKELEVLLAQTSIQVPSSSKVMNKKKEVVVAGEEVHSLKEEIRVLSEAMEVLQTQVDEYEREIRSLREPQSHQKTSSKSGRRRSNMNSKNIDTDFSSLAKLGLVSPQQRQSSQQNQHDGSATRMLSLEASLFRPALRLARSDASMWKSRAIDDVLLKLPPLGIRTTKQLSSSPIKNHDNDGYNGHGGPTTTIEELVILRRNLILANAQVRRVKATVSITDLTHNKTMMTTTTNDSNSRPQQRKPLQFYDSKDDNDEAFMAMERLEEASSTARYALAQFPSRNGGAVMIPRVHSFLDGSSKGNNRTILGRVRFSSSGLGNDETKEEEKGGDDVIPVVAQRSEIIDTLHSILLR